MILTGCGKIEISIHALRGEGDVRDAARLGRGKIFLSTPSAGRATSAGHVQVGFAKIFLSTPSAGRATDFSGNGIFIV